MKHLYLSLLALGALAIPPHALADVSAKIAEACQTLGGTFEMTTSGYGSNAVTKLTCRFPDGSGRSCDPVGACGALGATSTSHTSGAPDSSSSGSSDDDACYSCRKTCAEQCSSKGPLRAQLSCRRECVEDRCQAECTEAQ